MPFVARLFCGVLGVSFCVLGVYAVILDYPFSSWKQGMAILSIIGVGGDLLYGAFSSRWPIAVAIWLVP